MVLKSCWILNRNNMNLKIRYLFIMHCNSIYIQLCVASWMLPYWSSLVCPGSSPHSSGVELGSEVIWLRPNTEIWIKQSSTTSPQFLLIWPRVEQRLQPSRIRSIVIALWGNLVCHLWISAIVGRHRFELPGQLCAEQKEYLLESLFNMVVHYINVIRPAGSGLEHSPAYFL